jgi:phosphoribosylformylglycinamidine synthase
MGQFVGCIEGMAEACSALDYPVVSGNVSLYNETNGVAIPPTPAIGGIGLIPDVDHMATVAFKNEGDVLLLVGETLGHLGQSLYLREIADREEGTAPPVNLDKERKNGDFVRSLINSGMINACHDISDGGLLVAIADMAITGNLGVDLSIPADESNLQGYFFGEDQARYLLTVSPEEGDKTIITRLGTVGGTDLTINESDTISIDQLADTHERWLPEYMATV